MAQLSIVQMLTRPDIFADDYPPQRLLHREREVEQLLRLWSPAAIGQRADDVLLYGPHGVGKTALVGHARNRIGAQGVATAHVECLGETMAGIVRSVLQQLGEKPAPTTPREDLCLMLRERVDEPLIVILDEADDLCETEALDRLNDVDLISWVVICHNPDEWLASADGWVRQRLHGQDVGLGRFGTAELADILEVRADRGLQAGAVSRDQLEQIADDVAGNARRGIQVLREAARQANRQAHDRILDEDIEDAYPLAQRRMREYSLHSLPFHHQVVYEIIRTTRGVTGRELHDIYDDLADEIYRGRPMTPITSDSDRRRKLRKLREYDLVEKTAENRHGKYVPCDAEVESAVVTVTFHMLEQP